MKKRETSRNRQTGKRHTEREEWGRREREKERERGGEGEREGGERE